MCPERSLPQGELFLISNLTFHSVYTYMSVQCRSAALAVMAAMLDGSKRFLAAADDHVSTAVTPFTPFSTHLGAILRELHHRLLLAVSTETQPTVLTRAVRCLAVLASNTPYQQLTSGYASQILSALQPLSCHKGCCSFFSP